jgi:hypothetical protein
METEVEVCNSGEASRLCQTPRAWRRHDMEALERLHLGATVRSTIIDTVEATTATAFHVEAPSGQSLVRAHSVSCAFRNLALAVFCDLSRFA